ncbi:MAG: enoyl-CoA hydratase [Frankiales bacterium]|nr:enoyl-CoA hydratase [Frankiales bacterium]
MNSPDVGSITCEVQDGVAVVTLNRPERLNALRGRDLAALGRTYAGLDKDDDVHVVVLTGAGRAFCSGADLAREKDAFAAPAQGSHYRSSPPRPLAFQLRKPVVAAVNGHAIGLGMTLALHCDLRFMSAEAKWGVVQNRRGVVPDAVSHWTLTRAVGLAASAEILLGGQLFTGTDALRLRVASRVLPAEEVLPAAVSWAREVAREASPMSLALSKRILWAAADGSMELIDELESEAHRLLMGRPDSIEGGRAALQKRPPVWSSRVTEDWPAGGPLRALPPEE